MKNTIIILKHFNNILFKWGLEVSDILDKNVDIAVLMPTSF